MPFGRMTLTTASAVLAIGALIILPGTAEAGSRHGCPSGYVCLYHGPSWDDDSPESKYFYYGTFDISERGMYRIFNNQDYGDWVDICRSSSGTDCPKSLKPGAYVDIDLTPINSIRLHQHG